MIDLPLTLDETKCTVCGVCVLICPTHCFAWSPLLGPWLARPGACTACGACELLCEPKAITVKQARDQELATSVPAR